MSVPLNKAVLNIKPSGIRKFFDLVSEMKDVISLGVGEPDFDTPWHIRDEGIYALERGKTFYTSNAGLKELREEILNGKDFADVAAEVSLCPSGANGGDLGFFGRGVMVREFEEAAFSMNVGDLSEPIQTQFGWHLLKLTDKKD